MWRSYDSRLVVRKACICNSLIRATCEKYLHTRHNLMSCASHTSWCVRRRRPHHKALNDHNNVIELRGSISLSRSLPTSGFALRHDCDPSCCCLHPRWENRGRKARRQRVASSQPPRRKVVLQAWRQSLSSWTRRSLPTAYATCVDALRWRLDTSMNPAHTTVVVSSWSRTSLIGTKSRDYGETVSDSHVLRY